LSYIRQICGGQEEYQETIIIMKHVKVPVFAINVDFFLHHIIGG